MKTIIQKADNLMVDIFGGHWWKLTFKLRLKRAARRYPKATYSELIHIVNGFTDKERQDMIDSAIRDGWIAADTKENREEVFSTDLSYWEA